MVLREKPRKRALPLCRIVSLASLGLSCAPGAALTICATETNHGVIIENMDNAENEKYRGRSQEIKGAIDAFFVKGGKYRK